MHDPFTCRGGGTQLFKFNTILKSSIKIDEFKMIFSIYKPTEKTLFFFISLSSYIRSSKNCWTCAYECIIDIRSKYKFIHVYGRNSRH